MSGRQKPSPLALLALVIPAVAMAYFSTGPRYRFNNAHRSALALSFKHTSHRVHECSEEEKRDYIGRIRNLKHAQNAAIQCGSRERLPVGVWLAVDGKQVVKKEITPSGWRRDSAVYVMEKVMVESGVHRVEMAMRDSGKAGDDFDFRYDAAVEFPPGKIVRMDFNGAAFAIR